MVHWTQRARWIVAVVGLLFAALVFVGIRHRQRPATAIPIAPTDPRADVEVTGATSQQWSGANENFTVKAERQLLYRDGGVKLQGVTVYVDDREGNRKFVVTGREGEVEPGQTSVNLKGEVEVASSDGLKVETAEASYSTGEGVIRAPGPVTFSRGRLSGRGIGMTYDRSSDVLWLKDEAAMTVAPDEHGAGKLDVSAGTIGLARNDKYVRFGRDVRIMRDNSRIQADDAVGYLSDDESRLTSLDLRGNSRITTERAAAAPMPPGGVEDMTARDITLSLREGGEQIERAVLTGNASIRLAGEGQKPGRRIAGESLAVGLNPDGATVTSLSVRDEVRLEFPAEGQTPARSVRAAMLDSTANEKGDLTGARLTGGVDYRELIGTPPGHPTAGAASGTPPAARVVRARMLDLTFTPGMGGITNAGFSGAVRFDEGELHATSATARYHVDRGVVELSGDENVMPTVADARILVDARAIVLTMQGPKVAATGAVRSVLGPDKKTGAGSQEPPDQVRLPAFLTEHQPINVTADALDYDGTLSRAVYHGHARLWQGEVAVQGDGVTLDTKAGNLTATGSVRSTWIVEQADEQTKQKKRVPTIASAQDLEYDDRTRRATYSTDAHVNGPQGDLLARKIELYLGEETDEFERVEAYEAVTWREAGRSATGDRLSYVAAAQRYEFTGRPVRIVEECRESTGRTLTFYKSTDRVLVDGQQVARTRTKSGSNCSEPPRAERSPGR